MKGYTMKEARIEALKDLIKIVKQLKQDNIKEVDVNKKSNLDPAHESQESPEVETAEKDLDVELGKPMGEVSEEPNEEQVAENDNNPKDALRSIQDNLNKEEVSPFTTDAERMKKNKYKGGQYKAVMAGVVAKSEGNKNKRK